MKPIDFPIYPTPTTLGESLNLDYFSSFGITAELMAGQKRTFKEVDTLDSNSTPISSANIHGVVTSLSPVKKGKTTVYFDGTVSDGASKIRLVGFSSKQRKVMEDFMSKRQPVKLSDCEIKQARRGDQMEVLLKGNTSIDKSPKTIEVQSVEFESNEPTLVTLYELPSIEDHKKKKKKKKRGKWLKSVKSKPLAQVERSKTSSSLTLVEL